MTKNNWLNFIIEHPDVRWDYSLISINPNITWQDVCDNPTFEWRWFFLPQNPNISWKTIIDNLDKPWDFEGVSYHPELDIQFVLTHPQFPWEWTVISAHRNVTWDIVKANRLWNHPDKTRRLVPWKFSGLSHNPNITMDIVEANSKYSWSFPSLSKNPNLVWEFVEKHLDKNWNWYLLTRLPIITWDIVKRYPNLFKKYAASLCQNENITWDIIENDLRGDRIIPWDSVGISSNPNITIDIVKANRWVNWNYYTLSSNKNFTWQIINENPDIFPRNQRGCFHPRITIDLNEFTWEDWLAFSESEKLDMYHIMYHCPNVTWNMLESCKMVAVKTQVTRFEFKWNYDIFCSNPMTEPVRKRIQSRCMKLKDEIIAGALSPKRISYLIENYGIDSLEQF
jgi:hypothetical protein